MPFYPPSWVQPLPFDPPDTVSIADFIFSEQYGRQPEQHSKPPFICGLTGKKYSCTEVKSRVDKLARGLSWELGWQPNKGTEWDKIACLFSLNAIDYATVCWAVHRLGGIVSPANAAYSAADLQHQLRDSGATCVFTCLPLLAISLEAAQNCGIPRSRVFLVDVPEVITGGKHAPEEFRTVDHFIEHGTRLPQLDELKWEKGQGARQIAFLCYSSGTSGLPKGVMIAHRNVIANTMQYKYFEKPYRDKGVKLGQPGPTMTVLGLLPFSHIYGLIIIAHASAFRGDSVVVLPKFEFSTMLQAVERFKVQILYLVPPIVVLMSKSKQIMEKYNLDSVQGVFTGAAPLGEETTLDIIKHWPKWSVRQGYGLTETSTVVCATHPDDIVHGSSGSLVPSVEVRLVDPEGNDINEYDKEGELWVKSPSVVRGYLNNEKATKETFEDGYMKTGDVAIIRKSPLGHEHIFIIDRIKELIKVNAFQVAPAELEAHLLTHPAVNDCAVIQVPHDRTGEAPKAYVVKSLSTGAVESDEAIAKQIEDHVRRAKSKHKWLTGGVEFIDVIPKSPSGKILRRLLRDKDKADRRKKGARL